MNGWRTMPDAPWMSAWNKKTVPLLAFRSGVFIVGSQAAFYARGLPPNDKKDWDLLVEFNAWRSAAMSIPRTAVPNGNRGWRYTDMGWNIDIWPDSLARYLEEATSPTRIRAKPGQAAHAVCLKYKLVIGAERFDGN